MILRHDELKCPVCLRKVDAVAPMFNEDTDAVPSDKDFTLCVNCGAILQFDIEGTKILGLEKANPHDLEEMYKEDPGSYLRLIINSRRARNEYTKKQ